MKALTKSEWFRFDKPIGEPDTKWADESYDIERVVTQDETIIWFGLDTNWVKKNHHNYWEYLLMGDFYQCDEPIYEQLYKNKL